jgi:hypothetical protein
MKKLELDVERVTVLRSKYRSDKIIFNLSEEQAKNIHAEFYPMYRGCGVDLDVTQGRAEEVLHILGFDEFTITLID